jgi:hypothetical protein
MAIGMTSSTLVGAGLSPARPRTTDPSEQADRFRRSEGRGKTAAYRERRGGPTRAGTRMPATWTGARRAQRRRRRPGTTMRRRGGARALGFGGGATWRAWWWWWCSRVAPRGGGGGGLEWSGTVGVGLGPAGRETRRVFNAPPL